MTTPNIRRRRARALFLGLAIALSSVAGSVQQAVAVDGATNRTMRVSIGDAENQGNAWSGSNWPNHNNGSEFWRNSLSPDGRYIVFTSRASNFVTGDVNGKADVFVRDRVAGTTTLESLDPSGEQFSLDSTTPAISGDGRYVVFGVAAPADWATLYLRDRLLQTTTQISTTSGSPSISADGRYVSYLTGCQVYRLDLLEASTVLVSERLDGLGIHGGNGCSGGGDMSPDGRYIAFPSFSGNLVEGDTNGELDVFLRDVETGTTERVSVSNTEAQFPYHSAAGSVSADGRYVAFVTEIRNLRPTSSLFVGEIVLRDRVLGTTRVASTNALGALANEESNSPEVSDDGRYVMFHSWAGNLVAADRNEGGDTFVWDGSTGVATRVSLTTGGTEVIGNGIQGGTISGDGRYVLFESGSSSLIAGDTNGVPDLFLRDRAGELNDIVPPIDTIIDSPDLDDLYQDDDLLAARWTARDVASGVGSFDVGYRRAPYNSTSFSSLTVWRRTLATRGTLDARTGQTYCMRLRAQDGRTNLSSWGPRNCTVVPVDDRALSASSGWSRRSNDGHFLDTYTRSTTRGASLSLRIAGKAIRLVAMRCDDCGVVDVYFKGVRIDRIDLHSATTRRNVSIPVVRWDAARSGTVTIKVVSGSSERVVIDGLAVSAL